jgi:hypothetical protein
MANKYMGVGTALGAGAGTAIGAATHQMGVWLAIGVAVGTLFGMLAGGRKPGTGRGMDPDTKETK